MSRRRDNPDYSIWLFAIWTMLVLMAFNQCHSNDNVESELRDIRHEIHMLKYK